MTKKSFCRLTLIILAIFVITISMFAQTGRGLARVNGVVLDRNGNPVPQAKVTMIFGTDKNIRFTTETNKKGEWGIIGLGTGQWSVTVNASGYMPVTIPCQVKQLERNPKITITLEKEGAGTGIIQDDAAFAELEQGNQFFKEGKYDAALTMYEEFYKKNPGAYQIYISIGDCYREKGDFEKAIYNYNKLIEAAVSDQIMGKTMTAKALASIGVCYLNQNDLVQAQDYFKKSIEVAPQDELLAYNVAEIYFSNQNADEAQKYYELASQIKPDWPDPYLKLAYVFLNKGELPKAAYFLEKFIQLEPDSARTATARAILESIKK